MAVVTAGSSTAKVMAEHSTEEEVKASHSSSRMMQHPLQLALSVRYRCLMLMSAVSHDSRERHLLF